MNAIIDPSVDRATWLRERSSGVGGSECAAILANGDSKKSPWLTPLRVWRFKMGLADEGQQTQAMQAGVDLEPYVRTRYTREVEPQALLGSPGLIRHPIHHELLCTPDDVALFGLQPVMVELKTSHFSGLKDWEAEGAPLHYQTQALWNLMIWRACRESGALPEIHQKEAAIYSEMDCAHLAVVFRDDALSFRWQPIQRDPDWEAKATERVLEWWQHHVREGNEPAPTELDGMTLAEMFPRSTGRSCALPSEADELLLEMDAAESHRANFDAIVERGKAHLKRMLEDAETGTTPQGRSISWRTNARGRTFKWQR